MRGNVLDLAVAVVIGAAFTAVINSIVNGVINPVVGLFGTSSLNAYKSCIKDCPSAPGSSGGIYIMWGSVLAAVLQFVITAAVVYFCIVLPANHFMAKYIAKKKAEEEALKAAELTEVKLLGEIRDLLVRQR
ncbi:large conductance mechanosensitive channel protein MscL [Streptacidiphilus sp. N1-5]